MSEPPEELPVLTEAVAGPRRARKQPEAAGLSEAELARLRESLLNHSVELLERVLHDALADIETRLYGDITARLREELPVLIEGLIEQHLRAARGKQIAGGDGDR